MTPTPRLVTINSWSHSRASTYSKCPALAKFKFIDKLTEPGSSVLDKGNRVHGLAQIWVTKSMPKDTWGMGENLLTELREYIRLWNEEGTYTLPFELARFEEEFAHLQEVKAVVEESWCFDKNWQPRKFDDWNNVWLRIKTDSHYLEVKKKGKKRETTVYIIDYKTGKEYPEDHEEQRSLYALGALLRYPDATEVVAEHWYMEAGVERKSAWAAADLEKLKEYWLKKTTALLNDTTFAPRRGEYCRSCYFRKASHCTICGSSPQYCKCEVKKFAEGPCVF